jgi:hypothetical protein
MAVEPLLFELSTPGRRGVRFPEPDVPQMPLPEGLTEGRQALRRRHASWRDATAGPRRRSRRR